MYYMNWIKWINLYKDILSWKILNKYIIEYLVYLKKPDIIETNKKTYIEKKWNTIIEEKNTQYEEYLNFIHSYDYIKKL
jgi:hypothetical protein